MVYTGDNVFPHDTTVFGEPIPNILKVKRKWGSTCWPLKVTIKLKDDEPAVVTERLTMIQNDVRH